ncbi:hypothetical protein O6H91_09G043900 [Diphasiastrum complanatum]|uniref:Uncharacterized protein n=1 Tax=Diphasiastrum complanatum TaxID=34168 RepID=A0ACC2CNT1_DIPCM|nr:hypothetical protein O6H91_09G043900 [Diphasiastrum complanatum]
MDHKAKVDFDQKMFSLMTVLRSLKLALLIGWLLFLSRSVVFGFVNCSNNVLFDAWKSWSGGFSRHTLFFIVNIVVLVLLVPSGLLSRSRTPHGYRSVHKLQNTMLKAGQRWKTAGSGQTQSRNWNRRQPEGTEGSDLTSAFAETEQNQCCLAKPKPNVIDNVSTAKALRSTADNQNELLVKEELDDLHERIEAFIAKAKRQMMLQE